MDLLKTHSSIRLFLAQFPETQHNSCLLALSLLGLSLAKTRMPDYQSLLDKILKSEYQPTEENRKILPRVPKIPKIPKRENLGKHQKLDSLPLTIESLPTSNSFRELSTKNSPRGPPGIVSKANEGKSRCMSGSSSRSIIDIADGFMDLGLIQEIYQKEMVADRMKVPFRKKWEMACKAIGSN